MTTRNATLADAPAIARLSGQLGYATEDNVMQGRLAVILPKDDNCVLLAVADEQILGWVHGVYALRVESGCFVEIAGLVVDEHQRRKGIGKLLVEQVAQWAQSKGCNSIRVRCNVTRTESHRFYEGLGFGLNKEQKVFDKKLR